MDSIKHELFALGTAAVLYVVRELRHKARAKVRALEEKARAEAEALRIAAEKKVFGKSLHEMADAGARIGHKIETTKMEPDAIDRSEADTDPGIRR